MSALETALEKHGDDAAKASLREIREHRAREKTRNELKRNWINLIFEKGDYRAWEKRFPSEWLGNFPESLETLGYEIDEDDEDDEDHEDNEDDPGETAASNFLPSSRLATMFADLQRDADKLGFWMQHNLMDIYQGNSGGFFGSDSIMKDYGYIRSITIRFCPVLGSNELFSEIDSLTPISVSHLCEMHLSIWLGTLGPDDGSWSIESLAGYRVKNELKFKNSGSLYRPRCGPDYLPFKGAARTAGQKYRHDLVLGLTAQAIETEDVRTHHNFWIKNLDNVPTIEDIKGMLESFMENSLAAAKAGSWALDEVTPAANRRKTVMGVRPNRVDDVAVGRGKTVRSIPLASFDDALVGRGKFVKWLLVSALIVLVTVVCIFLGTWVLIRVLV